MLAPGDCFTNSDRLSDWATPVGRSVAVSETPLWVQAVVRASVVEAAVRAGVHDRLGLWHPLAATGD